jgi:hypothetical protein
LKTTRVRICCPAHIHRRIPMAYFTKQQDSIDRGGKVLADIFCAVLILTFAVVFFGVAGGALAFLITEGILLGIDYVVAKQDDVSGAAVR